MNFGNTQKRMENNNIVDATWKHHKTHTYLNKWEDLRCCLWKIYGEPSREIIHEVHNNEDDHTNVPWIICGYVFVCHRYVDFVNINIQNIQRSKRTFKKDHWTLVENHNNIRIIYIHIFISFSIITVNTKYGSTSW